MKLNWSVLWLLLLRRAMRSLSLLLKFSSARLCLLTIHCFIQFWWFIIKQIKMNIQPCINSHPQRSVKPTKTTCYSGYELMESVPGELLPEFCLKCRMITIILFLVIWILGTWCDIDVLLNKVNVILMFY